MKSASQWLEAALRSAVEGAKWRWAMWRLARELKRDPIVLVKPNLPELPERIEDYDAFFKLTLRAARAALPYVEEVAALPFPGGLDALSVAVVRAHLVRLHKYLGSMVTLFESGHTDTAAVLSRSLMETVINLDFLLESDDLPKTSRGFVCRSIRGFLKPLGFFEERIAVPEDPASPTDDELDAFALSLRPVVKTKVDATRALADAGIISPDDDAVSFLTGSEGVAFLKAWPEPLIQRATTETALTIYRTWFSKYSLATHPNWMAMVERDLLGEERFPCTWHRGVCDPTDITAPAGWSVGVAARFATLRAEEGEAIALHLREFVDFFGRAYGLVPFFPGMDEATLDVLLEDSSSDEEAGDAAGGCSDEKSPV